MVQIHIYFGVEQLNMRARATINSPWTLPIAQTVYEAKITRELFNLEHHNLRPRFIRTLKTLNKAKGEYHCGYRFRSNGYRYGEIHWDGNSCISTQLEI
jgi:hypothetical protein